MKIRFLPGLLLVFLLTACTISRPLNLHGLKNAPFEDPILRPDYDLYGLRIDIIRQTHDESETDSTSTTEKASDDGRKLEIFYAGRKGKQHLLYTLERTENALLVYNRKKHGMLIRLEDNRLDLVRNDKVVCR
ncbi:MAG TPA: hypothetical protein PKE06_21520 [Flavilitoribacter sp.]|nr:hypothetical protein [Flavilitoribacter sp.]HMQ86650.1 hypothetical protein [Flavilitoribacter sp.]